MGSQPYLMVRHQPDWSMETAAAAAHVLTWSRNYSTPRQSAIENLQSGTLTESGGLDAP